MCPGSKTATECKWVAGWASTKRLTGLGCIIKQLSRFY